MGLICDTGCYEDPDSQANDLEESWEIFLITIHEDSIPIYCGDESSLKIEKIAEKICKITDKKASHRSA